MISRRIGCTSSLTSSSLHASLASASREATVGSGASDCLSSCCSEISTCSQQKILTVNAKSMQSTPLYLHSLSKAKVQLPRETERKHHAASIHINAFIPDLARAAVRTDSNRHAACNQATVLFPNLHCTPRWALLKVNRKLEE